MLDSRACDRCRRWQWERGWESGVQRDSRITIAVTAMITESGVGDADVVGLALLYVGVSTVLVWAAALFYILWGQRATDWLTGAQHWIVRHKEPLTFYPSAVLGLVLVIDGVVQLVG